MASTHQFNLAANVWTLVATDPGTLTIRRNSNVGLRLYVGEALDGDTADTITVGVSGAVIEFGSGPADNKVYLRADEATEVEVGVGMTYRAL